MGSRGPDMSSYLQHLSDRLAAGVAALPEEGRAPHVSFLHSAQNPDGGWSGREGGSDLYYTGFALRSLAVLGALTPEIAQRSAHFLKQSLNQQTSVVDFFSLLYACLLIQAHGGTDVLADSPPDWPDRVAATLETFRTRDGGYAKATDAVSGSTYHTFLVGLCYQLLGRSLPLPREVFPFLRSRRREDGGFVELAPMRRSGTNPTAAAVGIFQLTGGVPADLRDDVVNFLAEMPSEEGGLRANTRIPVADLLSTFTGLWTLEQLGALDRVDAREARAFAVSLEEDDGGFRAGIWDDRVDVEYTFYGLGVLSLLSADRH
jgi:geranylgeranyl transferase type-2 subunit beta